MEDGFVKGYSDNLPYVDFEMVYEFMNSNKNTVQAEIKHGKTVRWVGIQISISEQLVELYIVFIID